MNAYIVTYIGVNGKEYESHVQAADAEQARHQAQYDNRGYHPDCWSQFVDVRAATE